MLDDTGREIEALLAEGVAPERGALLAPSLLFVYGTLMAGEGLHDHLREHLARQGLTVEARRASVAGRLFDLDAWPGLVPDPGSRERVTGELYPLDEGLLRTLDQVEDFFGYGQPGSSFRRLPIATVDARGAHALAWCYRVVDPAGAPLIPSGDWRRR